MPMRIGLLLIDGFALMSYAAFIEPLRAANSLAGETLYDWSHISLDGREVRASNGAGLLAEKRIGDDIDVETLMVFAAGEPAKFRNDECFAWLRSIARRGITIGGVSGGPFLLARAGVLAGHRATIHWEHVAAFQDEFPDLQIETNLFVIDRSRITCAGGTAGLDLAIKMIEEEHGASLAHAVGEWFIRSEARASSHLQRPKLAERYGTVNSRLLTMLDAMERRIESPLPRKELAALSNTSVRHLERLCGQHLGSSINEIYMTIRLNHGAQLLRSTDLNVTNVAMASGFRSSSHFSRRFTQKFGSAPSIRQRRA